ncbi:MAG: hypothetical protein JWN08_1395 [Frankiales bacterium]|nr:hypothetical protein [Frankiales bacterium]
MQVLGPLDLEVVERPARLRLLAGRLGIVLDLRVTEPGLLELAGLADVVCSDARGRDPLGQPEAREQRGAEEVVDVDQLPG